MAKVVDGNFGKYPTGLKHTDVLTRPLTLPTGFSRGKTRSLTLPGVTYTVCCHKRRPSVRHGLLTMFPKSDHHEIAHAYAQEIE